MFSEISFATFIDQVDFTCPLSHLSAWPHNHLLYIYIFSVSIHSTSKNLFVIFCFSMGNLQSNPSSSTQIIEKKYEVFLNFRGVDTRDGFTNYLYEALLRKSIETFMDEAGIERGEEIWPKLSKTIRDSMIFVVIFSKEYASSKWCLRELVEILKSGGTVIPVFYKVTVHDVRHQEGSFKDGFDQLEKEFRENLVKKQVDSANVEKRKIEFYDEMQEWRQALGGACELKGQIYEKGPESEFIDKIVKDIWEKLMRACKLSPCDFKGLFGFEKRFKQVMSLLSLDNADIRIIGIWGMGGIGKTTIADAIFHQISYDEYGKCFIQNVRQRLEQGGGLVSVLQEEVLSKVLNDQDIKLDGVTLPKYIKRRLYQKKVFIVLDDVDNFLKLEKLAGGLDRLSPGSRIIITTRNRDILRNCQVNDDYIYEVKRLSDEEAQKLFCKFAFRQSPLTKDLMALSHEILQAINGNPLGLKVAGSSLLRLNELKWQSALNRLKKSSEILEVLQISYDGLEEEDRHAFLDIACFFVGEHEDYVAEILDNSYSLEVLSDRSLITISDDKIVEMHDLLQEMGREIVRKEDCNNPGHRSRLWTQEDVLDRLNNGDHAPKLKRITLKVCPYLIKVSHILHAPLLQKIEIHDCNSFLGFPSRNHFPALKYLHLTSCNNLTWISDFLDAPSLKKIDIQDCENLLHFPPPVHHFNNLCELNLSGCKNLQSFPNNISWSSLVSLDLSGCINLARISDVLDAPLLEKIDLCHCKSLLDFPPPVHHFNSLRELNLRDCKKLQSFPNNISLSSLVSLNLSGCIDRKFVIIYRDLDDPLLEKIDLCLDDPLHEKIYLCLDDPLPEKIDLCYCKSLLDYSHHFNSLRELNIRDCKKLKSFPNNISFPSLVSLDLSGCIKIDWISDFLDAPLLEKINLNYCESLLNFPLPVHHFNNLRELNMRNCENLQSFPNNISFPSLVFLDLSRCIKLARISNFLVAPLLENIDLYSCSALLEFPSPNDRVFDNHHKSNMKNCNNLKSFGKNIHFPSLISLNLSGCHSLTEFSDLLDAPLLEPIIRKDCSSLCHFPTPSQHFNKLCHLNLENCKNLRSFPSDIHFLSLTALTFSGCFNLKMFPNISGNIKTLSMSRTAIDEVPSTIENLPELVELDLTECTFLELISTSICKLKALRKLHLRNCYALKCFPEILDAMGNLKLLDLEGTAIKGLHHSIENLSGLEMLCLQKCRKLEMLPISIYNLTSLNFLNLSGCLKLEKLPENSVINLSTKPPSWRLDECKLDFTCCLKLNKTAVINIMKLQINQHRDMTTKGRGTQAVSLKFLYPGSEVPGWFNCQTDGSSINIQMSGHDGVNGHLIGFASCAVIEGCYDFSLNISYQHRCHCKNLSSWNHSPANNSIEVWCVNETLTDHVALWYSNATVLQLCGKCTNYLFEFHLRENMGLNCRVKYCGVCPIYEKRHITLPSIANETCGAADQDFGETFIKGQGKIRKFSDEPKTSGISNEDVIEPHPKRNCS